MATNRERLHHDHDRMRAAVETMRATADAVTEGSPRNLAERLHSHASFLVSELAPHARAEEEALYPAVREAMGSAHATAGMEHDHEEIRSLTVKILELGEELQTAQDVTPELARRLRQVLYGMYLLLLTHLEKEESIYLPVLERRLPSAPMSALLDRLEAAEEANRASLAAA